MNLGLVWFRDDLRLADNPALEAALRSELAPVPIYIHAPDEESRWRPGAASDAWRHRSLGALGRGSRAGSGRDCRSSAGPSAATLAELVAADRRAGRVLESTLRARNRRGVTAASNARCAVFGVRGREQQREAHLRTVGARDAERRTVPPVLTVLALPRSSTGSCRRSRRRRGRCRPCATCPTASRSTASGSRSGCDWMLVSGRSGGPARPVRHRRSSRSRATCRPATARDAIAPICAPRRGCRRICISARSRPGAS